MKSLIVLVLFTASLSFGQTKGFIRDTLSNTTSWVSRTLPSTNVSTFDVDIYNKGSGSILVTQSASDTSNAVSHVSTWWAVESGFVLTLPNRNSNVLWFKVESGSAIINIFKY